MYPVCEQVLKRHWLSVYRPGALPLVHFTFSCMQAAAPAAVMLSGLKLLGVVLQAGCWANARFPLHLHKLVDTEPEWKQEMSCLLTFHSQYKHG